MIIKEVTNQKVICLMTYDDEVRKCREIERKLRPNYDGYRYVNLILGSLNGGLYSVQKFIFRATFGNEKEYCDCVSQ